MDTRRGGAVSQCWPVLALSNASGVVAADLPQCRLSGAERLSWRAMSWRPAGGSASAWMTAADGVRAGIIADRALATGAIDRDIHLRHCPARACAVPYFDEYWREMIDDAPIAISPRRLSTMPR